MNGRRRRVVPRPRRVPAHAPDAGFTLTEVLVSLAVIGVVMSALTTFFVNSMSTVHQQGSKQDAVQVASSGVDRVRAMNPADLLVGRDNCAGLCTPPVQGVVLSDMQEWDKSVTGTAPKLPIGADVPQIRGSITYTRYFYVGKCWQPSGGGACTATSAIDAIEFVRVVVAVTWPQGACSNSICTYTTSTLVNADVDPVFNSNDTAAPPVITNPGDQYSDVGVPLTLQLTGSGPPPLSWNISQLPAGLTADASGKISGTPQTQGTFQVKVVLIDGFTVNNTTTAYFNWTITPPPTLTSPGAQAATVNAAVSLKMATYRSGGAQPFTWTATGLPDGLTIDAASGVISGTPQTTGSWPNVTVTVTDGSQQSASTSFAWTVNPQPRLTNPGTQWTAQGTQVSLPITVTGGTAPMTWSASGLPTGLKIASGTGVISGAPTTNGQYQTVTVTVTDKSGQQASTTFTWVVGYTSWVGKSVGPIQVEPGSKSYSATNLPPGLTMDANGVVTGTPTNGTRYVVTVKDKAGTTTVYWQVLNPTGNPNGLQVTAPTDNRTDAVRQTITPLTATATGGSGQGYSWADNGTLPSGLTISAGGSITGTPSTRGTYTVKLTVKDSAGNSADFMFIWTIQ